MTEAIKEFINEKEKRKNNEWEKGNKQIEEILKHGIAKYIKIQKMN